MGNMSHDDRARGAHREARSGRALAVVALLACAGCSRLPWSHPPVVPAPSDSVQTSLALAALRDAGAAPARPPAPIVAEPPDSEPEPAASDSAGLGRLLRLAEVWHTVALHHPWVATRGVPWDSALIIAAPRVRAARDDAALVQAYRRMFALLRDPRTRVDLTLPAPAPVAVSTERIGDSIAVVRIAPSASLDAADSALVAGMARGLPSRVILDLRGAPVEDPAAQATRLDALLSIAGLADQLVAGTLIAPSERTRRIGVWPPVDDARGSRVFHDGWSLPVSRSYTGHGDPARRIVVLADSGTVLPGVVLALLDASRASLVADGGIRDAAPVPTVRLPISSGFVATIRAGELVHADGSEEVSADSVIERGGTVDAAFNAALGMLRATAPLPRARRRLPWLAAPAATPVFYDTTSYPYMGARLLAGFRLWSAMRARHAHRDLYDDALEGVFERVIPRLESARSAGEYARAIAELAASLEDSEGTLQGPSYEALVGRASLPFRVQGVDGRYFITDIIRDSVTTTQALVPGTELVALDGFPVTAWLSEHRRAAPASNEWTRLRALQAQMSRGQEGSALVRVRDAGNRERGLTLPRRVTYRDALPTVERPDGAPVRTLADGIMYVDLERLTDSTVDAALASVASARGVVLDLRGRITVDDRRLLRHLATRPRAMVARVVQRTLTAPCMASIRDAVVACPDVREMRSWWREVDTAAVLRGRLVALIDERTQGAAERFALSLEQMSTVTFVGSASAGAVSWTTPLSLPGGLAVGIATQEVRRADGSQVQRVGITPLVDARPTARGIRAGEDEVRARAQQWLQEQLDPSARRRR